MITGTNAAAIPSRRTNSRREIPGRKMGTFAANRLHSSNRFKAKETISAPLRQLQIRVDDAAVNFNRVVVHFGNGADEEMQFREVINAGGSTRPLNCADYAG